MTMETSHAKCGQCRHWKRAAPYTSWGDCLAPIPIWIHYEQLPLIYADDAQAQNCDAFEKSHVKHDEVQLAITD